MKKPITIIGGGLAGLTLGIALRRRDVPVTIIEAGRYPRHRVCGEFISGDGLETLKRLNLRDELLQRGARYAETAEFFFEDKQLGRRNLPKPALCLSRFKLDAALAELFKSEQGKLSEGERWTTKEVLEGCIRASGRRPDTSCTGWRLIGLKVHANNVPLTADLEMHFHRSGYVGMCRLAGNIVNVCGLFRSRTALPEASANPIEFMAGKRGTVLHERLTNAMILRESFSSVAALSLKPRKAIPTNECCIGDALTMIPPVTGNGMSMAFESAELATEPLNEYASGKVSWAEAKGVISVYCNRRFQRRLRWAEMLQSLVLRPAPALVIGKVSTAFPTIWRWMFGVTR